MDKVKLNDMTCLLSHSGVALLIFSLLCVQSVVKSSNFKGSFDTSGGKFTFGNPVLSRGQKLSSAPIDSKEVVDEFECILACAKDSRCRSSNLKTVAEASGKFLCQLLDTDQFVSPELFNASVDHQHYSFTTLCELNPCMNGATCQPISNEHKCICAPGYYGKLCNVSYESCDDLLNAGYNKTGIYSIKPAQSDMWSVYCDQTSMGGGWTMVFKVVSGVAADIEQLWSSADSLNEDKTEALDISSSPPEHYKNRLVPNWQTVNPTKARVALYENNNEAFSIVFDAVSSDNMNWFSANRVNSSPWTDLISNPPAFFSIPGSPTRPFYISGAHFGCETDAGWLVVGANHCLWETRFSAPTVMYSKLQHSTAWSVYENVGVADVMIVYIR